MFMTLQEATSMCFRVDDIGYKQGDIIAPGRWGKIILETGANHLQYEREQLLEKIRTEEFAGKPSRITSNFAFKYWNDGDAFQQWRWDNGSKQHLYHVVPTDLSAAIHIGYMYCMPPKEGYEATDVARAYWRTDNWAVGVDFQATSPVELVIASPLKVLKVLSVPA